MPYVTVRSIPKGVDLDLQRGDTWSITFQRLGDISLRDKLWFTIKGDKDEADAAAWVQIEETAGLEYIAGAAAGTPANGSITVTDVVAGDMIVALATVEAAKLDDVGNLYYGVQMLNGSVVTTMVHGRAVMVGDTTRATI